MNRIQSETQHATAMETLLDIISLEDLQQLQDALADLHQFGSFITDSRGRLLTVPSNESPLCRLLRESETTACRCAAHMRALAQQAVSGRRTICCPCEPLGFLNAVIPIIIGQRHLANWWIKMACASDDFSRKWKDLEDIGLPGAHAPADLPPLSAGNRAGFEKAVHLVDRLVANIMQSAYQKQIFTRQASEHRRLESELQRFRADFEHVVQERTAELIKTNSLLQMEVLERDLAEEQVIRKSNMLNAINRILQHTLDDHDDGDLALTFLKAAEELTASPHGFVVERLDNHWIVVARDPQPSVDLSKKSVFRAEPFLLSPVWRKLVENGETLTAQNVFGPGLPRNFPPMLSILAVPLRRNGEVFGFVTLANKAEGYAYIDSKDIESLSRVFVETLWRKRNERVRHKSEKRLNFALDAAREGLWDYSTDSGEIYFSPSWFSMLGYAAGELPSNMETWATLNHPEDHPRLEACLRRTAQGLQAGFDIEIRMLAHGGQWHWIQVQGRHLSNDEPQSTRIVGMVSDISRYKNIEVALQKANEELQRLAALDGLTQIANRLRFEDRLNQEWARARRERTPLAVILCDIDFFKNYNDTYGHLKGDETLSLVAQTINTTLKRSMDLVARYGGEEFAMILPNTNAKGAEKVAQDIKQAIEQLKIEHKASKAGAHISLSFGVAALIPNGSSSARTLVEAADRAMYIAKKEGRNRIARLPGSLRLKPGAKAGKAA